jgi:hypothetical protein
MSILVAAQSAAFYFLACTPCIAARNRNRTKKRAKMEREERGRRHADQPNLYRHPSPFNMNPYWQEDMAMGPSLPPKKGGKAGSKNNSQRKLASAGSNGDGSTGSGSQVGTHSPPPQSSPTLVAEDARSLSIGMERSATGSSWNTKRYQREEEELWGQSRTHKLMDAIVKAGSSAGRLIESRLGKEPRAVTEEDRAQFYSAPIHPPVNDYHPPVVLSRPAHKDALRWMLQPPPPAKIMEGKVPVSRSASFASSRKMAPGSDVSLGRAVGERSLDAKLRKGEGGAELEKIASSPGRSSTRKTSQPTRDRSQRSRRSRESQETDSDEADSEGAPIRRRRQPRRTPVATPTPEAADEKDEYFRSLEQLHAAQRPRLETIVSSDASSRAEFGKENVSLTLKPRTGTLSDPIPIAKQRSPTGASIDSGLALSA